MRHATLTITRTGTECAAYRLSDGSGRVVWRNRVMTCQRATGALVSGWGRGRFDTAIR